MSGLSQKEMAAKVHVGLSTYRMWESGTQGYSGPTREQALRLNEVLIGLLGERYIDGQIFDVWGWPAEREINFGEFAKILQSAGFVTQHLRSAPPSTVFWVQRLREPNLVHGVLALAAAAATRAGLSVRLLLDDINLIPATRQMLREEFDFRLGTWFEFASGDKRRLTVGFYSGILTDEMLDQRGWAVMGNYLNSRCSVLEFLLASKAVSPLQYNTDADQSVLELVRQEGSLRTDRLITPIRNWIIFDCEISEMADKPPGDRASIVTLGGEDERVLWELWHRGCAEKLSARVQHIYLRPVPMPSYRVPWQEPALTTKTNRPWLATYLKNRMGQDRHTDLIEWVLRAAVMLPAALNPDYRTHLPDILADPDTLLHGPADHLSEVIAAAADAVVRWLIA